MDLPFSRFAVEGNASFWHNMKNSYSSINDVAKAAGVTKSTVSNVFSGQSFVSKELTKKVLAAAKKLDYTPGFFAAGLSGKRNNDIIGLFLESTKNEYLNYFDVFVGAVLRVASQAKKRVLIFIGLSNEEFLQSLRAKTTPMAGVILVNPVFDDARVNQLKKDELPVVLLGKPMFSAPRRLKYVDVDNEGLVGAVVRILKEAGHQKIAFIHANENMTLGLVQRQAFDKAIPECKDLAYPMYVGDVEESYDLAKRALSHNATAIICANPNSARGAYRAIKDCGKRVGKDVAVFSLGASSASEAGFHPSLSYASQNYAKLGGAAAKMLIAMVDHKETRSHLVIKNKIMIGNSFFVLKK